MPSEYQHPKRIHCDPKLNFREGILDIYREFILSGEDVVKDGPVIHRQETCKNPCKCISYKTAWEFLNSRPYSDETKHHPLSKEEREYAAGC